MAQISPAPTLSRTPPPRCPRPATVLAGSWGHPFFVCWCPRMGLIGDIPTPCSSWAIHFATRLSIARQISYASTSRCCCRGWRCLRMAPQLVPGPLKRALDLLEADPARGWTVDEIASACGVGCRTLQRHFRRFIGRMPMEFLRDLRLGRARQELLRASGRSCVTDIAARSGFNHIGRFATQYRARYGESPSATLSRNQRIAVGRPQRLTALAAVERPAVAVLPFDLIGRDAGRGAGITAVRRAADGAGGLVPRLARLPQLLSTTGPGEGGRSRACRACGAAQ